MASSLLRRGTLLNYPLLNIQPLGTSSPNSVVSPADTELLYEQEDLTFHSPTWSPGANIVNLANGRVVIPSPLVGNTSYGPVTFINAPTGRASRVIVTVVNDATGNASLTFANTNMVDGGSINPSPGASTTFNLFTVDGTHFLGQVRAGSPPSGGGGPLTSISGSPVNGYALTSTGVAGQGQWSPVTATTIDNVAVSGGTSANRLLTATSSSTAVWGLNPNTMFTIATGLDSTQSNTAAANNSTYLTNLIQQVANTNTGDGGMIMIPPAPNAYPLASEVEVLDGVFICGSGYNWMKQQGVSGLYSVSPSSTIFRAFGSNFQSGPAAAMFHFNSNGGMMNCHVLAGNCGNGGSTTPWAPIGIWVSGGGNTFENVVADGGYISWFHDSAGPNDESTTHSGNESSDNMLINCYMSQEAQAASGTSYYVTYATNNVSTGNSITVNSAKGINPGMYVIDLSNPGNLATDCIVYNTNGTTITLSAGRAQSAGLQSTYKAIQGPVQNDTLLFVQSPCGVICSTDTRIHGLRAIVGTYICSGDNTIHMGCHFSTGGNAGIHNVIHKASANYVGCTFDNGNLGSGTSGHVLKVSGAFLEHGGRIQSGVTSGSAFPHIHDPCGDSGGILITDVHVPHIQIPLDSLIAYSASVWDDGTSAWVPINGVTAAVNNTDSYSRVMIDSGAIGTNSSGTPRFVVLNTGNGHPATGSIVSAIGPWHDAAVASSLYST